MAALATTTLGQALSADALTVYLASGTGVSTGTLLYMDQEAMSVTGQLTTLVFAVQRGAAGTTAAAHAAAATVYLGSPTQFYADDPVGTPETYPIVTPWINLVNGSIWVVSGSAWVLQAGSGVGDVVGPASATSGDVASFSGTTGKLIADGSKTVASLVVGPASATDNAVVRFDATTGKLVQNSAVTIADTTGDIVTAGDMKAATYHVGATAGASAGPFTVITSITVVNGIVTDLQGS